MQKNQENHSTLSTDIGDWLFHRTLGMQDHTQLKGHDSTVASIDVELQATNKQITQLFPEILALCYFGEDSACPGMPGHTQQILHDLTKASMDIKLHAKNDHLK